MAFTLLEVSGPMSAVMLHLARCRRKRGRMRLNGCYGRLPSARGRQALRHIKAHRHGEAGGEECSDPVTLRPATRAGGRRRACERARTLHAHAKIVSPRLLTKGKAQRRKRDTRTPRTCARDKATDIRELMRDAHSSLRTSTSQSINHHHHRLCQATAALV